MKKARILFGVALATSLAGTASAAAQISDDMVKLGAVALNTITSSH